MIVQFPATYFSKFLGNPSSPTKAGRYVQQGASSTKMSVTELKKNNETKQVSKQAKMTIMTMILMVPGAAISEFCSLCLWAYFLWFSSATG